MLTRKKKKSLILLWHNKMILYVYNLDTTVTSGLGIKNMVLNQQTWELGYMLQTTQPDSCHVIMNKWQHIHIKCYNKKEKQENNNLLFKKPGLHESREVGECDRPCDKAIKEMMNGSISPVMMLIQCELGITLFDDKIWHFNGILSSAWLLMISA